jgi:hypothetical protein
MFSRGKNAVHNPKTAVYNASAVKTYNATNSLARFRVKIIFLRYKNALAYYNAGVVISSWFSVRGLSWGQFSSCKYKFLAKSLKV